MSDPTAGEHTVACHEAAWDEDWRCICSATPDAGDASTSASEPLSEDERGALQAAVRAPQAVAPDMAYVYAAVKRIVAAREAKARAEAGEHIAQAIEAACTSSVGPCLVCCRAARIAREVTESNVDTQPAGGEE